MRHKYTLYTSTPFIQVHPLYKYTLYKSTPFIRIHSVDLTAAIHNRRWNFSYYNVTMPAWTKQHLILYFPELNNRMNLSSRNMFRKSFIFYFLLLQKLPYDFFKIQILHFLNLKIQIQYFKNVFKYSLNTFI